MKILALMDPEQAPDSPPASQAGGDTAAIDANPFVLLGVQFSGSFGSPSPIGVSYNKLA